MVLRNNRNLNHKISWTRSFREANLAFFRIPGRGHTPQGCTARPRRCRRCPGHRGSRQLRWRRGGSKLTTAAPGRTACTCLDRELQCRKYFYEQVTIGLIAEIPLKLLLRTIQLSWVNKNGRILSYFCFNAVFGSYYQASTFLKRKLTFVDLLPAYFGTHITSGGMPWMLKLLPLN